MTSSANISFTISTSIRVAFEEGSKDGQHLKLRSIQSSCNDEIERREGCEKSSALSELKQVGRHCGRTMPSNPRNREPVTLSTKDCCQVWEEVKKTNKIDVFAESFMTTTQELLGHLKNDSLTEKEKATIVNFMCDSGVIDIHTTTRVFSDDKNSTENTGLERTRISVSPEENDPSNNTGRIAANITEGNEVSSEPFHMEYTHGNISDELDECEIQEISVKVEKEEGSSSLTDQEFFEAVSMVKDESEQGKRREDDHWICAPQDSSNPDTGQISSLGPEISDPDYVNSVPPPSITAVREVLETYTGDKGTDSVTLKIEDKIRKDRKGTQRYGIPGEQEHSSDRSCSENDKHSAYYVCDSTESTERNHGDKIQQENVLKSLDVGFQGGDPKPGDGGTAENIWICITDERLHDAGNAQLMIPAQEIPDPGIKWSATSHNKDNAAANSDGSDVLRQTDKDRIDIQSSIVSSIGPQSLFSHQENSNHLRNGPCVPEEGNPSDTDTADDIILDKETDDEQFVVKNKRFKKMDGCHNDDGNDADDDDDDEGDGGGGAVAAGDNDADYVDNHGDAIAANTADADADGDKTEGLPEVAEMSTSINMEKKRTAEFIPGEGASKTAQFRNDDVTNENDVKSRFSEQGHQENHSNASGGNNVCDTNEEEDEDTDDEGEESDDNEEEEEEEEEEYDNSDDSDYDVLADLAGSYDSDFDSNGDYIGYHKRFYEIVNQTNADFVNIKHSDTQEQFNKKQSFGTDNVSSHSLSHDISDTLSRTDKGKLNSKCSNTDVISEDNSKIADLVSRDQSQSIGHLNSDGMSVGNNEINAIANKKAVESGNDVHSGVRNVDNSNGQKRCTKTLTKGRETLNLGTLSVGSKIGNEKRPQCVTGEISEGLNQAQCESVCCNEPDILKAVRSEELASTDKKRVEKDLSDATSNKVNVDNSGINDKWTLGQSESDGSATCDISKITEHESHHITDHSRSVGDRIDVNSVTGVQCGKSRKEQRLQGKDTHRLEMESDTEESVNVSQALGKLTSGNFREDVSTEGKSGNTSINPAENNLECKLCGKKLGTAASFRKHMRRHAGIKPFQCDQCGKRFYDSYALKTHKRTHTGEKPFECNWCGKCFMNRHLLVVHSRKHTGENPFKCDVCGRGFREKKTLTIHRRIHTGERPYTCKLCKRSFSQRSILAGHMRMHTGEKPFSCDICHARFSRAYAVMVHKRVHTGEKPYSCTECDRHYSQKSQLTQHMSIVHLKRKPFKCETCGKSFSSSSNYKSHLNVHIYNEGPFDCEVCGKSFQQKQYLSNHSRVHQGRKPFMCRLCGNRFLNQANLDKHMRKHADMKPFQCSVCGKRYGLNSQLACHMKVHGIASM